MDSPNPRYSPQEFAALLDAAKARAVAARNEAIAAFWAQAVAGVRNASRSLAARTRAVSTRLHPG